MGGSRSSSKLKSSKRKSSKISSEARLKKKSRLAKSRKLRRRDYSSSSDDSSSTSISSSSSEDDYGRARSRARTEMKGSRKRTRRSSSSHGSSVDSRRVKKRKGSQRKESKRNVNSDTRKKSQRKKSRREPSVSSLSIDSQSCSTCRGGSSKSGDSEFERPRSKSRKKGKDKRDMGEAKSVTKSNKNRPRSCSSCSKGSDSSGYNSKGIPPVESSSRRLRSVIIFAKSPEREEKERDEDVHKEEIACDHDDYPSCRSNDSNDGGSKREIAHHSHIDFERKGVENLKGVEAWGSDFRKTKLTKSVQDCQSNSHCEGAGSNISIKENNRREDFPNLSSSDNDYLESILRLKALENLRKYRGGFKTNAKPHPVDEKNKSDSEVKQFSTEKVEFVQNSSAKEDGHEVAGTTRLLDQNLRPMMGRDSSHRASSYGKVQEGKGTVTERGSAISPPNQAIISRNSKEEAPISTGKVEFVQNSSPKEDGLKVAGTTRVLDQNRRSAIGRDSSHSSSCYGKAQEGKGTMTELGNVFFPPNQATISGNSKEEDLSPAGAVTSKSAPRQESSGGILKQTHKANMSVPESIVNKSSAETSKSVGQTIDDKGVGVNNVGGSSSEPSSSLKPSLEEYGSKDKDGSQFEQKTMSVMRGGEMVQVSYKVYIPKKAPALARRQLRR
ncbi:hypothetical protein U1Q18_000709 [Sarracenia purpurea var. burkii]